MSMNSTASATPVTGKVRQNHFDEPMHPAQVAAMRRLTLSERFALGLRFLRSARGWLVSGIRARHPEWSEEQVADEVRRAVTDARS